MSGRGSQKMSALAPSFSPSSSTEKVPLLRKPVATGELEMVSPSSSAPDAAARADAEAEALRVAAAARADAEAEALRVAAAREAERVAAQARENERLAQVDAQQAIEAARSRLKSTSGKLKTHSIAATALIGAAITSHWAALTWAYGEHKNAKLICDDPKYFSIKLRGACYVAGGILFSILVSAAVLGVSKIRLIGALNRAKEIPTWKSNLKRVKVIVRMLVLMGFAVYYYVSSGNTFAGFKAAICAPSPTPSSP